MTTSAKNYTKKIKQTNKKKNWTDRTLGEMVTTKLYRQNHTKKHTYTHSQKKKKEKNIYILKKRKRATKSINKYTNDNKLLILN